ncbi:MAG: hypothetical protein ACE5I0_09445, partial [Candidatus Binatia bacterium]
QGRKRGCGGKAPEAYLGWAVRAEHRTPRYIGAEVGRNRSLNNLDGPCLPAELGHDKITRERIITHGVKS